MLKVGTAFVKAVIPLRNQILGLATDLVVALRRLV